MTTQKINNSNPYDNGSSILQPARVFNGNLKSLSGQFPTAIDLPASTEFSERVAATTKSSAGYSDSLFSISEASLIITSAGWGAATLQVSGDNISWVDLENSNGVVSLSANKGIQVYGGLFYRLNITSYVSPVTLSLYRLMK